MSPQYSYENTTSNSAAVCECCHPSSLLPLVRINLMLHKTMLTTRQTNVFEERRLLVSISWMTTHSVIQEHILQIIVRLLKHHMPDLTSTS